MTEAKIIHLKHEAKSNAAFRKELYTATSSQLTIMSLRPGQDIGEEVHMVDQLIYVLKGEGRAVVAGASQALGKGDILCVPAGIRHNVTNTDDEPMKLASIYAPPQHAPGTLEVNKKEEAAVLTR